MISSAVSDQELDFLALVKENLLEQEQFVIGKHTARHLIVKYNNLRNLFENLNNLNSQSIAQKLYTHKSEVINFRNNLQEDYLDPAQKLLVSFFKEKINGTQNQTKTTEIQKDPSNQYSNSSNSAKGIYASINLKQLQDLQPQLEQGFAIDLETTGIDIHNDQIVGISISVKEKEAYYIPLNEYIDEKDKFNINPVLEYLKPILEDENIPKYTHNGKYEYCILKNYGIELKGIAFDTLIASYLLYPGERLGLKEVVRRLFDYEMTTYEDVTGKGKSQVSFDDVSLDHATEYAGADADFTLRLTNLLKKQLEEKGLTTLNNDIELPLQTVLAKMEYEGVSIDIPYLAEIKADFEKRIEALRNQVFQISGYDFNLNSTQQLGKLLYDELKLPALKQTKTTRSTDSETLEKLVSHHEIAAIIFEYRKLEKLLNTYVKKLPELVNPKTKKIHTSFNQTVTATGRLSSSKPNLQNIPIRSEDGSKLRKAIIPSKGNKMLAVDYSQIELRVMAHLCKDQTMVKTFQNNEDIHTWTAATIEDIAINEVTKDQRSRAKAVNFGIIYGISSVGLARNLNISEDEAEKIIENYFTKFPRIKEFMNKTISSAKQFGYVKTEFGRIRRIPQIRERNRYKRSQGERMAINTRVQGTAADIIKLAMVGVQKAIEQKGLKSRLIIQVHDELVFDVVPGEENMLKDLVKDIMENVVDWDIPVTVDMDIGSSWQDAK